MRSASTATTSTLSSSARRLARRVAGAVAIVAAAAVALVAGAGIYLAVSFHNAVSHASGTISGLALSAPVTIARDERGIPHIKAQNEHDLFFADGYVEGADR
ncbi:MAG: penicillin acylase family protein, partial [Candidatus Eremiobacteraeota bacterium]|nr:penicillin acylase family protein [Candidatus Eremiobacteraeota bacterium]